MQGRGVTRYLPHPRLSSRLVSWGCCYWPARGTNYLCSILSGIRHCLADQSYCQVLGAHLVEQLLCQDGGEGQAEAEAEGAQVET